MIHQHGSEWVLTIDGKHIARFPTKAEAEKNLKLFTKSKKDKER